MSYAIFQHSISSQKMFLFCVSDKHFGATLERIIDFRTKLLPKKHVLAVNVKLFYPGK